MPENNPATGQPYGGLNSKQDDSLPGEKEVDGDESRVGPPPSRGNEGETGSRAAQAGAMASDTEGLEASPGIPGRVEPPGPGDATDGAPPGGSAANQDGRDPAR